MSPTLDLALCVALVGLSGLVLFLRLKFPNASRRAETVALAVTAVLFFMVCHIFLAPQKLSARPDGQPASIHTSR